MLTYSMHQYMILVVWQMKILTPMLILSMTLICLFSQNMAIIKEYKQTWRHDIVTMKIM